MVQRIVIALSVDDLERILRKIVRNELQELVHAQGKYETLSVLSQKEVLELLGISLPTLHSWERKKLLRGKRIGRRVYYLESEILEVLNSKS